MTHKRPRIILKEDLGKCCVESGIEFIWCKIISNGGTAFLNMKKTFHFLKNKGTFFSNK